MPYPRKPYIVFSTSGYRIMPEVQQAHGKPPLAEDGCKPAGPSAPCDLPPSSDPDRAEAAGDAEAALAFRSPLEGYRLRRRAGRRHLVGAFFVLVLLSGMGVGAVALAVTDNLPDDLDETHIFSGALPLLPERDAPKEALAATSTPPENWTLGEAPYLYQKDPQWIHQAFSGTTLGFAGQIPLCLSIAGIGLTGSPDLGPIEVAGRIDAAGIAAGENADPSCIPACAEAAGLKAVAVDREEHAMRRHIVANKPVICAVGPGDFAESASCIVLVGIDMDGDLVVRDPASDTRSHKHWDFEAVIGQSTAMYALSVPTVSA